jgi:hypothetical protein
LAVRSSLWWSVGAMDLETHDNIEQARIHNVTPCKSTHYRIGGGISRCAHHNNHKTCQLVHPHPPKKHSFLPWPALSHKLHQGKWTMHPHNL